MRMSQSTDEAEGLERRKPTSTRLSLAFPASQLHIYTGLSLSQRGHWQRQHDLPDWQAGRQQALSCYWMEQRGVRESGRAQNRKSDQVIGFLPTSHSFALSTPRALWIIGPLPLTHISNISSHFQLPLCITRCSQRHLGMRTLLSGIRNDRLSSNIILTQELCC